MTRVLLIFAHIILILFFRWLREGEHMVQHFFNGEPYAHLHRHEKHPAPIWSTGNDSESLPTQPGRPSWHFLTSSCFRQSSHSGTVDQKHPDTRSTLAGRTKGKHASIRRPTGRFIIPFSVGQLPPFTSIGTRNENVVTSTAHTTVCNPVSFGGPGRTGVVVSGEGDPLLLTTPHV